MKIWEQITEETWERGPGGVAGARCAIQWISKIYELSNDYRTALIKFTSTLGRPELWDTDDLFFCITNWNDAPERTFEEVLEAFKKADL